MIKIWEPRYRDRKVLIAAYKYKGQDLEIEITKKCVQRNLHRTSNGHQ